MFASKTTSVRAITESDNVGIDADLEYNRVKNLSSASELYDTVQLHQLDSNNSNNNTSVIQYTSTILHNAVHHAEQHIIDTFIGILHNTRLFIKLEFVLQPDNIIKRLFDYICILLSLYSAITVPWYIAFSITQNSAITGIDVSSIILICIDMLLTFRTGFMHYDGHMVYDTKLIVRRYMRGRFVCDVLSTLPLIEIASQCSVSQSTVNWYRLNQLLRIYRIFTTDVINFASPYLRIAKLFAGFIYFAHIYACVFYYVGVEQIDNYNGWIAHNEFVQLNSDTLNLYISAIYYSLETISTIGYGDITPRTISERSLFIPFIMISTLMYATIFGNIAYVTDIIAATTRRYQHRMDNTREFCGAYGISNDKSEGRLGAKIRKYAVQDWLYTKGFDTKRILHGIPTTVQAQVLRHLYGSLIKSVPLFSECSDKFLDAMVLRLKLQLCLKNDCLFKEGDKSRDMYFIRDGTVEVAMDDPVTGIEIVVNILSANDSNPFFGEISLLLGELRTASVRAVTKCVLATLTEHDFFEVLEMFPDEENSLRATAMQRLQNDMTRAAVSEAQRNAKLANKQLGSITTHNNSQQSSNQMNSELMSPKSITRQSTTAQYVTTKRLVRMTTFKHTNTVKVSVSNDGSTTHNSSSTHQSINRSGVEIITSKPSEQAESYKYIPPPMTPTDNIQSTTLSIPMPTRSARPTNSSFMKLMRMAMANKQRIYELDTITANKQHLTTEKNKFNKSVRQSIQGSQQRDSVIQLPNTIDTSEQLLLHDADTIDTITPLPDRSTDTILSTPQTAHVRRRTRTLTKLDRLNLLDRVSTHNNELAHTPVILSPPLSRAVSKDMNNTVQSRSKRTTMDNRTILNIYRPPSLLSQSPPVLHRPNSIQQSADFNESYLNTSHHTFNLTASHRRTVTMDQRLSMLNTLCTSTNNSTSTPVQVPRLQRCNTLSISDKLDMIQSLNPIDQQVTHRILNVDYSHLQLDEHVTIQSSHAQHNDAAHTQRKRRTTLSMNDKIILATELRASMSRPTSRNSRSYSISTSKSRSAHALLNDTVTEQDDHQLMDRLNHNNHGNGTSGSEHHTDNNNNLDTILTDIDTQPSVGVTREQFLDAVYRWRLKRYHRIQQHQSICAYVKNDARLTELENRVNSIDDKLDQLISLMQQRVHQIEIVG